jgi:hypothetical protein
MFGDPATNPKGWTRATIDDMVSAAKDGPHVSPTYADLGVPFLSTRHIKPGKVIWEDLRYITQEEAQRQWRKCKPGRGDILYTKGGTTGLAVAVDFDDEFAVWIHVCQRRRENASPWRSKDAAVDVMRRAPRGPSHLVLSRAAVSWHRSWARAGGACFAEDDSSHRSFRGCGRDG